jgi:RNA polymerase sigma-70 factor, ECF subfamily
MDGSVARNPPLAFLYRTQRARAVAVAGRILGDRAEAEDVVQEVFARLFAGRGRFDGRAAYSTWLYRILVNSSINHLRAQKRRRRLRLQGGAPLTPEEIASGHELTDQLDGALGQLGERHRQVLWLREFRGLSYPEIAALLHIPEGTVKSALNRGRARLLALVEAQALNPPLNRRTDPPSHERAR